jgi:hypothetical protein
MGKWSRKRPVVFPNLSSTLETSSSMRGETPPIDPSFIYESYMKEGSLNLWVTNLLFPRGLVRSFFIYTEVLCPFDLFREEDLEGEESVKSSPTSTPRTYPRDFVSGTSSPDPPYLP